MKGLSGFAALSARVVTLKGMGLPELGSAQAQLSAVQVGADQGLNDGGGPGSDIGFGEIFASLIWMYGAMYLSLDLTCQWTVPIGDTSTVTD